ncbi:MAG: hypothetical protein IJQ39_04735 [Thermoguttaceae bacterium]|nr:hypothetical protein [Thermoguttaceae bacterium]
MEEGLISCCGLRPRPGKFFGCVAVPVQDKAASADDTSANQKDGGAFHVLKFFGSFRRKRSTSLSVLTAAFHFLFFLV